MLKGLAEKFGVVLHDQIPDDGITLTAVERMIRQVVINLVGNAIKFTPPGGTVALEGKKRADGGYDILVRDTGIGMSEEEMVRAMLPFGQNGNRLTGRHDGTGLGLPLAKAFTELHGGRLEIDSAPGIGTTMRLIIPVKQAA